MNLPKDGSLVKIANFIGGYFKPSKVYLDSFNPATGLVWAKIPDSDVNDVNDATMCAKTAFEEWSKKTASERSKVMLKIADVIEENSEYFAEIESHDQGKPVWLAKAIDIPRCIHNFRFFATAVLHETEDCTQLQTPTKALNYVQRIPVGVVGLISPWNLPLYLLSFKIAPAIATGNTVVAKPSEMTSVSAYLLAQVFLKAGLPPGVVNFVFGTGPNAGAAIVSHRDIPLISFTGSTLTGERIMASAAPLHKKLSLEMGGKNGCIVFEDVNLADAVPVIIRSAFANQGEICLCMSRIFVHRSIFDTFVELFVTATKQITVGDPSDDDSKMGALVSEEHLAKVTGYVKIARTIGATIRCGDEELNLDEKFKTGYFMRPTVITNITDESAPMKEEIFGPVTCIVPFDNEDEVITRVNNVPYGLCASVWSNDVKRVHRVAQQLEVGTVWCNCWLVRDLNVPFGGMKASGIGREGLKDSIDFFTEKKTICVAI